MIIQSTWPSIEEELKTSGARHAAQFQRSFEDGIEKFSFDFEDYKAVASLNPADVPPCVHCNEAAFLSCAESGNECREFLEYADPDITRTRRGRKEDLA